MEIQFVLFCLAGGIVFVDGEAFGQFMISQPLVAGAVAGLIFGNWMAGCTVGLLMQLPYLAEIPMGGTKVSLGGIGAYCAAGIAASFSGDGQFVLPFSLAVGILVSWVAIPVQNQLRSINLRLARNADAAAAEGNLARISQLQYLAALVAFAAGALTSGFVVQIAGVIWRGLLAPLDLPLSFDRNDLLQSLLLGAGAGAVIWLFVNRQTLRYGVAGAGLGVIYLILNFIA
jgi:mannose/fructose/N-acetylgalactosamine-specific phosphotransferase system component IIC